MTRPGRARRGVALMLALWLIVVLGAIASSVASSSRASTSIAANLRAHVVGRYAAESGITLAVTQVGDSLALLSNPDLRRMYLNSIETAGRRIGEVQLGGGGARFAVTFVDVSSRLDLNAATRGQLARFFSFFVGPGEAESAARAIREWIGAEDITARAPRRSLPARTDIAYPAMAPLRPLRSLEDLRRIRGVSQRLALNAAPFVTVDGDGRINRMTASDTVLAAAAGSLVDEPSRIMIVARGWLDGQPLTYEIQAVYAIEGNRLVVVRWRERDL